MCTFTRADMGACVNDIAGDVQGIQLLLLAA